VQIKTKNIPQDLEKVRKSNNIRLGKGGMLRWCQLQTLVAILKDELATLYGNKHGDTIQL
jgi:hypothetical protein